MIKLCFNCHPHHRQLPLWPSCHTLPLYSNTAATIIIIAIAITLKSPTTIRGWRLYKDYHYHLRLPLFLLYLHSDQDHTWAQDPPHFRLLNKLLYYNMNNNQPPKTFKPFRCDEKFVNVEYSMKFFFLEVGEVSLMWWEFVRFVRSC